MGKDMMVQLLRVNMLNCFTSPHFSFVLNVSLS